MHKSAALAAFVAIHALVQASFAFECGVFPGEWRTPLKATGDEMILRASPSTQSRVVDTIKPQSGDTIEWIGVRFRTVVPGLFLAREDGVFSGSSYGRVSYLSLDDYRFGAGQHRLFHFSKGDTIEYLQPRSEGWYFVRRNRYVMKAELPSPSEVPFQEIKQPKLHLWIQLADRDGEPMGWYQLEAPHFKQPGGPDFLQPE